MNSTRIFIYQPYNAGLLRIAAGEMSQLVFPMDFRKRPRMQVSDARSS